MKAGTFDREGRRIHGVIGRDIIADSLVFGFDRDQGVDHARRRRRASMAAGRRRSSTERVDSARSRTSTSCRRRCGSSRRADRRQDVHDEHRARRASPSELRARSARAAGLRGDAPQGHGRVRHVATSDGAVHRVSRSPVGRAGRRGQPRAVVLQAATRSSRTGTTTRSTCGRAPSAARDSHRSLAAQALSSCAQPGARRCR